MVAHYVATPPVVQIEEGLVRVRWGSGSDLYWRPSMFEEFLSEGAHALHEWREAHRPIPLPRRT